MKKALGRRHDQFPLVSCLLWFGLDFCHGQGKELTRACGQHNTWPSFLPNRRPLWATQLLPSGAEPGAKKTLGKKKP